MSDFQISKTHTDIRPEDKRSFLPRKTLFFSQIPCAKVGFVEFWLNSRPNRTGRWTSFCRLNCFTFSKKSLCLVCSLVSEIYLSNFSKSFFLTRSSSEQFTRSRSPSAFRSSWQLAQQYTPLASRLHWKKSQHLSLTRIIREISDTSRTPSQPTQHGSQSSTTTTIWSATVRRISVRPSKGSPMWTFELLRLPTDLRIVRFLQLLFCIYRIFLASWLVSCEHLALVYFSLVFW